MTYIVSGGALNSTHSLIAVHAMLLFLATKDEYITGTLR